MQRRAVAMYLVFFVVAGAAAYGLLVTASPPTVSVDGPTYTDGQSVTFGDRTYQLSVGDSGGELTWTNESAVLRATVQNGTEVPPTDVVWQNQEARHELTVEDGAVVASNGSKYRVTVNESAGTVTLVNTENPADNATAAVGETLPFRNDEAVVTAVSGNTATLVWGNPYLLVVRTANVTDPTAATFVEQRNLEAMAAQDPALYDSLVTLNGTVMVTYRANDTNVPAMAYFGPPERHTVSEGETLRYQGNETTVERVTNTSVVLTWPGTETNTISLREGENVTLSGTKYFAVFPPDPAQNVRILPSEQRYADYRADVDRLKHYKERKLGLWGVAELSAVAAIILIATALLPVKE